ncbi:MAG: 3-hydroxyacyl-CoA dehydrogenase NAD-binding domain-containing protein [Methylococcales bacterium]
MKQALRKAAVIGAGVMGAKIAAHIANAGIQVYLLDVVPQGAEDRDTLARSAIDRLLQLSSFPAFTHPDNAKRVIPGNVEDHLARLKDVDWIVEAIVERLDVKQALYRNIEEIRNPDCIVSSNTSTIPLGDLSRDMPEGFARNFLITHFFNPPRTMRLLEIISGPMTRAEVVGTIRDFIDQGLGKCIVECSDTPGFICNRIGVFWLQCALHEAIRLNLSIEDVDVALSKALGNPKTGIFGLFDLIGLDLMPHIIDSLKTGLPDSDPFQAYSNVPGVYHSLLDRGHLGRKTGAGFYRIHRVNGKKTSESIDLASGEYRATKKALLELPDPSGKASLRALLDLPSDLGRFAWKLVSETLNYSAGLVPEIARNLADIDRAMRLGFNWNAGPFEMMDRVGIDYLETRIRRDGKDLNGLLKVKSPMYRTDRGILKHKNPNGEFSPVPPLPGVLSLQDFKRRAKPLLDNPGASLWNIGDAVVCFEFHTPMNALNTEVLDLLQRSIDLAADKFRALVIYNEGPHFSSGANLKDLLAHIEAQNWTAIETIIRTGQRVFQALKVAPLPVVGAPSGFALGGGAEILLHCRAIQAHIELQMGLVETGVGLIPGWGGCKEILLRNYASRESSDDDATPAARTFALIANRRVSGSAQIARDLNFLRPSDSITMNRDRLLSDAKTKALQIARHYSAPKQAAAGIHTPPIEDWFPGAIDEIGTGHPVSDYERSVLERLASVLSAGRNGTEVDERTLLERELENFLFLVRQPKTRERIEFLLKTGRPLDN